MAEGFRREGGQLLGRFERLEIEVVTELLRQTRELVAPPAGSEDPFESLLREGAGGAAPLPEDVSALDRDPALDRLLPPAHQEDEEMAAEYRRFTERGLRERKAHQLDAAVEVMAGLRAGEVHLPEGDAAVLAVALTDVRLVLGERLQLRDDEDLERLEKLATELEPQEPLVILLGYYDFLTWLQEALVLGLSAAEE